MKHFKANKNSKLNTMGTASVSKLILQFSVPAIVSMVIESLYNMVDRYFVGQCVGFLGIAGITLCFPIMLFIMALSIIIGVGANTLFSIRLGERKYEQARLIMNNAFVLLVLMALFSFTVGEIFMEPLLQSFGASDETLPYAVSYMRIILCGAIFQTVTPGMNHFIRSMGHPKTAMFRVMTGAGCNIFFDWLFVMKFNWGIEGAAYATVLSQLIAGTFVMSFFFKKQTPIKFGWRYMKLKFPYVRKIFLLGLPPSIMQICNSLMNVILNNSLAYYGAKSIYRSGDMAISAFGIVNSVSMFIVMPLIGFVQGVQPLIGYNYGAQKFARVRRFIKLILGYGVSVMCVAWILVQCFAEYLVAPFAPNNPQLAELASSSMRLFLLGIPMIAIGSLCGNFFQGTGKPWRAIFLNMSRQVIVLIPMLLIIPRFLGLKGVFMAAPISDCCSAAIGMTLLWIELRKMPHNDFPDKINEQKKLNL